MPQPITRVAPNAKDFHFTDEAISKRPSLGAQSMTLIAACSRVDLQSSYIFATAVGANHERAAKLLTACESASAKAAMIKTAIEDCLSEHALQLYCDILKSDNGARNIRNDFAHGLFGYTDDLPDALLLIDARYFAEHGGAVSDAYIKLPPKENIAAGDLAKLGLPVLKKDKIYVYRENDLSGAIAGARKNIRALKRFQSLFSQFGGRKVSELRTKLESESLIQPRP